jgi:hypothetical protein
MRSPFFEIRHLPDNRLVGVTLERKPAPRFRLVIFLAAFSAFAIAVGSLGVLFAGVASAWSLAIGVGMTAMGFAALLGSGTGPRYAKGRVLDEDELAVTEAVPASDGGHHAE